MFKILPIQDIDTQKAVAQLCGAQFKEGYFAYVMFDIDSGEVMGFSQFEISNGCGYIYDIKERPGRDDFEAMLILGRQTMNFIDKCGMHECKMAIGAATERLAKSIGFKQEMDFYFCNMSGMFDGKCDGHAVKLT